MIDAVLDTNCFHKFTHEIKNPLAICKGYLEIMDNCDEIDRPRYYQIIKNEIKRTLSIINDYSAHKLNYDYFNLKTLFYDVGNIIQHPDCKIIIMGDNKSYINADYNKLKQVFVNILKNAYEAKEKDKIVIVIDFILKNNNYEISITDNGIGMTKRELKKIYENYYTTKSYGTGLGIPFIKEIVELHGGTIKYFSKKNIGTKVVINIPK